MTKRKVKVNLSGCRTGRLAIDGTLASNALTLSALDGARQLVKERPIRAAFVAKCEAFRPGADFTAAEAFSYFVVYVGLKADSSALLIQGEEASHRMTRKSLAMLTIFPDG